MPQEYTAKLGKAGKGIPSCHKQKQLNIRAMGQKAQVCWNRTQAIRSGG